MTLIEMFDIDDLIMSTTSYYLGRRTPNVDDFCKRLVRAWPLLSDTVKGYVSKIVDDAFRRDDRMRGALGDDCDRASWQTVRDLWLEEEYDGVC